MLGFEIVLLLILPLCIWLWWTKLRYLWGEMVVKRTHLRSNNSLEYDEALVSAQLEFYRDVILASVTTGGILYFAIALAGSARNELMAYVSALDMARRVEISILGEDQVASSGDLIIKLLLAACSFLIVFGLAAAFLPTVFPYPKQSYASKVLSVGTAFLLAAMFAVWIGTSPTAANGLIDQITVGFQGVATTFLSVLFGAIGAYLVWARIKSLF
jgi:hypothetical protein